MNFNDLSLEERKKVIHNNGEEFKKEYAQAIKNSKRLSRRRSTGHGHIL